MTRTEVKHVSSTFVAKKIRCRFIAWNDRSQMSTDRAYFYNDLDVFQTTALGGSNCNTIDRYSSRRLHTVCTLGWKSSACLANSKSTNYSLAPVGSKAKGCAVPRFAPQQPRRICTGSNAGCAISTDIKTSLISFSKASLFKSTDHTRWRAVKHHQGQAQPVRKALPASTLNNLDSMD